MSGASELPERTLRWLQERNVFVAEEQDRGRCLKAARRFEAGTILFANRTVSFLVQKKKKNGALVCEGVEFFIFLYDVDTGIAATELYRGTNIVEQAVL
jgi:hypothetical protein